MKNKTVTTMSSLILFGLLLILQAGCGAINNDDGDDGKDSDQNNGEDTDNRGTLSIFDIQQGKVIPGSEVSLTGVIATSGLTFDKGGLFVQDPKGGEWSGIYIYLYDEVAESISPEPGDVINLTGVYEEFFDTSEIKITSTSSIEIVGKQTVPEPVVVNSSDVATGGVKAEAYEGVLVKVENVTVSKNDLGFGEFEVDSALRVDDIFFTNNTAPLPAVGATFDSITGPLHFAYEQFKIEPRSLDDFVGGEGGTDTPDDTDTDENNTGGGDEVTIYDIQQGKVIPGTEVSLKGVIATSGLTYDKSGMFVQEPEGGEWSGIYLYLYDEVAESISPEPGDVINLTGVYEEFYDTSEIKVTSMSSIEILDKQAVPAPAIVASSDVATGGAKAEAYEGVLVKVENVTVSKNDLGFGEFEVDSALRVDDIFFTKNSAPLPAVGKTFDSITGPLHFSYEQFKIEPRSEADLVVK